MRISENRIHPEIKKVLPIWKRVQVLVEEDEEQYGEPNYFITLPNESVVAKQDRRDTFIRGFINFAGSLMRVKGDSVYRKEVQRTGLGDIQEAFVKTADRSGQAFQEMLHNEVAPSLSAYGTVFAVLDKPKAVAPNLAEELKAGLPYLTVLSPFQVVDFEWSADGELEWFQYLTDSTQQRSAPSTVATMKMDDKTRLVTWTKTEYWVQEKMSLQPVKVPNPFGFVPVVIQAQFVDPNKTIGKSSFFASSNYIVMGNNLKCASNYEVFKNSSATLLMHIQDWGEKEIDRPRDADSQLKRLTEKSHEFKNVALYNDANSKPEYLARDLELIALARECAKEYFDLAKENERSAMSVNAAKVPQSGVSKSYDFIEVNNVLSSFASAMESFERQALRVVARMGGEAPDFTVLYPSNFDVRNFNEKIDFVKGIKEVGMPSETGMREAFKSLTAEITSSPDQQAVINKEIDAAQIVAQPQPSPATTEPSPNQKETPPNP